jgi:hypothetical protein
MWNQDAGRPAAQAIAARTILWKRESCHVDAKWPRAM